MNMLSLLTSYEIQQQLAQSVQQKRKLLKLSRNALAERSTVPASTIKKFETTAQISLRQFILLWQCVDSLENLANIMQQPEPQPRSIDEVLKG
ncbi:MAG TPA: transcriptional regulator [Leucothrix mucor]|nr:transcriptional regulator [Leucothrix mucor]